MSDLDKTGKKLIDSIRMTKDGPATAAVKSAAPKKASGKAAKKPKSSANRKQPQRKKTVTITDIPYQDGSQVWPD